MKSEQIRRVVIAAMMSAIVCVATMVINIPSPMNGYVNLGDCMVLLSAYFLGPVFGGMAAGIGSMLADLLLGYAHYAPGTLIIKGLMAVVAALIFVRLMKKNSIIACVVSGICAELIMIVGYFGYAALLMGNGLSAAASIPGNAIQGGIGIVAATALWILFEKTGFTEQFNK